MFRNIYYFYALKSTLKTVRLEKTSKAFGVTRKCSLSTQSESYRFVKVFTEVRNEDRDIFT